MNIKHILRKDGENDIKLRSRIKKEHQIADLSKKVERLEKQLAEANEVIKDYDGFTAELTPDGKYACKCANSAHLYLEKWGVK